MNNTTNNNNGNTSNSPFNHNTINRILKTDTHNVRSFTNPIKQQMFMQIYFLHHLDIIRIQETDLNNSQSKSLRRTINLNYQIFLNHNQSAQKSGFGVGLIIKKQFADHVVNV
jgi:exonuclease III